MNWKESVVAVRWNIQPFVDGHYRASTSTGYIENINPATERPLCQYAVGSAADVDAAVQCARARFNEGCWSDVPAMRRVDVLLKLADLLVEHQAELALLDTLEMGKPIQAALIDAATLAPGILRSAAGLADKLFGVTAPLDSRTLAFNTYQPRGVVGAIIPWNFPIANAAIKIAPALATGNTVVLKPSELSASSALRLAELAIEAGIPAGVLNVVPGLGSTVGAALASHPDVDLLSFTGSTATGRIIMELAAHSNAKPVLLECGGKSPQVVFDDVQDIDRIAAAIVHSALWNQGQVCSAHTRLIVHETVKDALLEKVIARACERKPGDPLDAATSFGPLASPSQRDRVQRFVEGAIAAGADPVLQGRIQTSGGCNVAPTVFDRVRSSMAIVREEIFGPVLCVQSFNSEAQALALANGTDYGLAATIWTRDLGRGRRLAHGIRAGNISIRTSGEEGPPAGYSLSREPQKASGFGAEVGLRGLEAYSTLKAVTFTGA